MSSVARTIRLVAIWLFVACCIVQVFLAGLGVFKDPAQFEVHAISVTRSRCCCSLS